MKKLLVLLAAASLMLACSTPSSKIPRNLAGTWSGEIEGLGLVLSLHLDDTLCTVDSPDQGAFGLRAEVKDISEESIHVKFPDFHAGLKATLQGNTLMVNVAKAGLVKVQVFDMMGHVIESHSESMAAGSFSHTFGTLSKGFYVVRVQQGSMVKALRMQVR